MQDLHNVSSIQKTVLIQVSCVTLGFLEAFLVLLIKRIQSRLSPLPILNGAVGDGVGYQAELAKEDLSEEQVNPRVQDLVERGQADGGQEEVTVQLNISNRVGMGTLG